ncbi:unnamed protein product [Ectocarpus sp. 4 AP-2014]
MGPKAMAVVADHQRTRGDARAKRSATTGGDSTSAGKRTHADIISREGGACGSSDSCVGDLMRTKSHARSWVSLRHNLHEALVESGEKGIERMQSLPKMSELVATMKDNAQHTRGWTRVGGEPIEHLRRNGVPRARWLYEGLGSVKRLSSSSLRGKRIITGPFGDEAASVSAAASLDLLKDSDSTHGIDAGGGKTGNPSSGDETEQKKDVANFLDFLASEFMTRLDSGRNAHARRQSKWKRSFEVALERWQQKQARSDEFFEIYRRVQLRCKTQRAHGIESAAANLGDYFLLEAAYDVDFDQELQSMYPGPPLGHPVVAPSPSPSVSSLHLRGDKGSPLILGMRRDVVDANVCQSSRGDGFGAGDGNRRVGGSSCQQDERGVSVAAVPEEASRTCFTVPPQEETESSESYGCQGLNGNDSTSARALVDDDDIDKELGGVPVTGGVETGVEGEQNSDQADPTKGTTSAGTATGTDSETAASAVEGEDAQEDGTGFLNEPPTAAGSADNAAAEGKRGTGADCVSENAQDINPSRHRRVNHGVPRDVTGSSSYRRARPVLMPSSGGLGGNGGGAAAIEGDDIAPGHGGHDCGSSSSTGSELTLGRPDPSSVHWKFSRRLLQTRTTPMALTETVEGGVELSLPHQSLGNTYIELISEVVKDLPGVTRLDLRDNRLTDVGVQEIVEAICGMDGHRGIQVLDLSENKLDTVSAQSLCAFLKSPTCCLREILLAKADIDDGETAIVMEAMQHNHSVRHLDFSDNSIGGGYEKTRTSGGPTTGGASIALALGVNTTIRRINLQWNLLGSKSGVLLGSALAQNHTLEYLDVSYNALGNEGAQAIGTALAVNDGLVCLDLSYNEISPRGALVIAQALENNDRLETLRLDGNSIGFDGGRTLVRSLNSWTLSRTLGLKNCMLESRARVGDCFDPVFPTGKYSLDCSKPYQKAVAYELLRIASTRPGSSVRSLVVRDHPSDKKGVDVRVVRPGDGIGLWKMLGQQQESQQISRADSEVLPREMRSRHGPSFPFATMDAIEWRLALKEAWVIDATTGDHFYPPDTGYLEVDFLCHPLPPTGWALINASGMRHLQALAEGDEQCRDQPLLYLKMASKDLFFSTQQVNEVIRSSSKKLNSLQQVQELLVALIPRLQNPRCLQGLLEMHLEPKQIHLVQRIFGHAFAAFTDCVGGHYSLDLSRELDREAAMRLSEWGHFDQMCLRVLSGWTAESGGTSQKGRWSSFRNERYRKRPFTRGLMEGFFKLGLTDRVPGVLEFDFVSIARPPSDTLPLAPEQFDRFVTECGLARLVPRPSGVSRQEQQRGGGSNNDGSSDDDFIVNAVHGLSLGDAVRLKLSSDTSEKLRLSAANAAYNMEVEASRLMRTSSSDCESNGDDDRSTGLPSPFSSPRQPSVIPRVSPSRISATGGSQEQPAHTSIPLATAKHRGSSVSATTNAPDGAGTMAGRGGSNGGASADESPAAARRRSLAAQLARQRLKKAARYAGAGLANAPPFVAKVSLGEGSLQEVLTRGGVPWKGWAEGKLSALWRHLLAKDCSLMDGSPPLLIAHMVRVRVCHGTEDKTLERRSSVYASSLKESTAWLSRGFLGRLVKTRGTRPGQDPKRVATSLVLDTFDTFLSTEADVWLVKRETLETRTSNCQGSPLCPDAPSIQKKTIEHIFDAYVEKLPDHDFGVRMRNQEGMGSVGVIGWDANSALEKSTTSCAMVTQPPRRELGQVPEDVRGEESGLRDVRGGVSLSADAKMSFSDGEGGASPEPPRFEFVWVASDEGEAGPHTAVAPRDAEWAAVARNVRFRLASAWLSCAQARVLAGAFPERAKGTTGNPREDLVVELFGRVTDIENYCTVLAMLGRDAQLSTGRRLGWLNALNPHEIDRSLDLDLRLNDHRRIARVLSEMAVVEPGSNLLNQRFSRHADAARHSFIPGWEVPQTWPGTQGGGGGGYGGVPDDGHFTVEYCSDEASGCHADPETRERLRVEAFLCGVPRDGGLGMFGNMDEGLARALAELPSSL